MYFIDYSASLSHHGVKGMKWGVRNAETRSKYSAQNSRKSYSKDKNRNSSGRIAAVVGGLGVAAATVGTITLAYNLSKNYKISEAISKIKNMKDSKIYKQATSQLIAASALHDDPILKDYYRKIGDDAMRRMASRRSKTRSTQRAITRALLQPYIYKKEIAAVTGAGSAGIFYARARRKSSKEVK